MHAHAASRTSGKSCRSATWTGLGLASRLVLNQRLRILSLGLRLHVLGLALNGFRAEQVDSVLQQTTQHTAHLARPGLQPHIQQPMGGSMQPECPERALRNVTNDPGHPSRLRVCHLCFDHSEPTLPHPLSCLAAVHQRSFRPASAIKGFGVGGFWGFMLGLL